MKKYDYLLRIRTRFLRVFFCLLYHRFSWMYDIVAQAVSVGKWNQWVNTTIPYLTGPNVLDLGHGPGHLIATLHNKGMIVYGLDESKYMGYHAAKRFKDLTNKPRLTRGYAQSLPYKDQTFDQVVATFPSEYIADPDTIKEIHRILIPGGVFVCLPSAKITGKRLFDRMASWLFKITGQSPPWDDRMRTPLINMGFRTRLVTITTKTWSLILIIAEKT